VVVGMAAHAQPQRHDSCLRLLVFVENVVLVLIAFYSRRTVRLAMANSPRRPLEIPRPGDDVFGAWWRTALQIPFHPRHMQIIRNVAYGPEPRNRLDIWRLSTTPTTRRSSSTFTVARDLWRQT